MHLVLGLSSSDSSFDAFIFSDGGVELDSSSSVSKELSIDLKESLIMHQKNVAYSLQRTVLLSLGLLDTISVMFMVLVVVSMILGLGHLLLLLYF